MIRQKKHAQSGIFVAGAAKIQFTLLSALSLFLMIAGCSKENLVNNPTSTSTYSEDRLMHSEMTQVNLAANTTDYDVVTLDPALQNAWGLAISDEGEIWVNAAETNKSFVFDGEGAVRMPPVTVPGNPTGIVYNETPGFPDPATGESAEFIFSTESGTIAMWTEDGGVKVVVDRSNVGAVYKGIAIGKTSYGLLFLYATDFHNGRVDIFDSHFVLQTDMSMSDPTIPAGYAPFGIKNIDGYIFVTYAKQLAPENVDDEPGPGHGFVNVFQANGGYVRRFASGGTLNSPWGIEQTVGDQRAMLIGNFGDGRISVFTSTGNYASYLQSDGIHPIEIEGLWAISLPKGFLVGDENQRLYFTAGPGDEEDGLFGYLDPSPDF